MSEPIANATKTAVKKPPPPRSPAYPFIPLGPALERARAVYSEEGRNAARPEVIVSHWRYSAKSSGGKQTLSALRQFGFLEGEGSVRLTDAALRILLDDREDSPDRQRLIRQAALRPQIHRRLWDRYRTSLPSEANLRHILIFDEGFNENSVSDFIREYRATIEFARLAESDSMPPEGEEQAENPPGGGDMGDVFTAPNPNVQNPPPPPPPKTGGGGGLLPVTFPLPGDNSLEIRLRSKMSKADFERLKPILIALLEMSVVEAEPS